MRAFVLTVFVLYCVAIILDVVSAVLIESKGGAIKPSHVVRLVGEAGFALWAGYLLWGVQ